MIVAATDFARLAERLRARAVALALAHATPRSHPDRWRRAGLLWPLFAKE